MLEDKEIVDTNKDEWVDTYESGWYEKIDEEYLEWHGYDSSISKIIITKQSDNLLDLLEVGDMAEKIDMAGNTIIEEVRYKYDLEFDKEFYAQSPNLFKAIWKRHNDTMRRYAL